MRKIRPPKGFSDITDLLEDYDGKKYDIKGLKEMLIEASTCIKSLRRINLKQYERIKQLNDNQSTCSN